MTKMDQTAKPADDQSGLALSADSAFRFVLTLGLVNLFADMTYEGGASINGPFLGSLGATAAAISIIAGVGEFLGYSLRLIAGYVADRTGRYWLITFFGYSINLLAVPAMALADHWLAAAALVFAERAGRAIRKPTVEAMLSYTTSRYGRGWVYALNTALDETGATLGPLLIALVLMGAGGTAYRTGYAVLLASSVLALVTLTVARIFFPAPASLEAGPTAQAKGFTPSYWLYMTAAAFFGAGLMSFEFVSFHFSSKGVVTGFWIPMFLAISTGASVATSLLFGRLYDRYGLRVILVAVLLSALFPPLVFLGGFYTSLAGLILWGIGYATQDTLLKALVAGMLPAGKRNLAFGLFYAGYGCGWLVGSVATGLLYEWSIPLVVAFSMVVQLGSLPLFIIAHRREPRTEASR
jgi:MFS family permease